jgi:non-lysosomal glucosylceramidase
MRYDKEHSAQISFPLGGIGSGCIGLAGNGQLVDWEIFNNANKGSSNGLSHFAVSCEKDGRVTACRILHGDVPEHLYSGVYRRGDDNGYRGFGWGPDADSLCGLPHFREHTFHGQFPFARIDFGREDFPLHVALHAWTVFIPGNEHDSSLPAAFFSVQLANSSDEPVDARVIAVLHNPWAHSTARNHWHKGIMHCCNGLPAEDFEHGELAIGCLEDPATLSYQQYLYRGGWRDRVESYWQDLNTPGPFQNRVYESPPSGGSDSSLLACHVTLPAKTRRQIRFVISWHVPNRKNHWRKDIDALCAANGVDNRWRNWYATVWPDALASCRYAMENYRQLHRATRHFHDALYASSLPSAVLEAISANLSILKSPTCLRLEDGTFYGWEGLGTAWGSCEGSCSHVWNYQQALPFLFPKLERSMRESHWRYSVDEVGGSHFRLVLPLGIQAKRDWMRPCVDGQMGDVMKAFRDWKISGDLDWLKQWYPTIRKSIEYVWSEHNPDQWDPQQSGVISGRQHHTLDMELFGPNAWLQGHYLGALLAAAQMADAVNDPDFAARCRELFRKGQEWTEEHLFNGDYYQQDVDIRARSVLGAYQHADHYWDDEHGQLKYQIGDGCHIDMQLAQCYATIYGIGELFDPERNRRALAALFRHNFRANMREHANQWRIYSLNDEGGLVICSWPEGKERPTIPIPYASETMAGFEYAAATHMISCGMLAEGLRVVQAIRERYDGRKRNPWNEIECGSNYARSMASYGLLLSYSGFRFDRGAGLLGFRPALPPPFTCFWSLGDCWGTYTQNKDNAILSVLAGALHLRKLDLPQPIKAISGKDQLTMLALPLELQAGDSIRCQF